LAYVTPLTSTQASANGVSGTGSVITGYEYNTSGTAVQWSAGTPSALTPPAGSALSEGYAVSIDGSTIVGFSQAAGVQSAVSWNAGTGAPTTLVPPHYSVYPDVSASAVAKSGAVTAIAGTEETTLAGTSRQAVVWVNNGVTTTATELGSLAPGGNSAANAVTILPDGTVEVVGWTDFATGNPLNPVGQEAFIWDPVHGMRSLADVLALNGLSGLTLADALGISADGNIITGYNVVGPDQQGWAVSMDGPLTPEPAAIVIWSLLGTVMAGACWWRKRKA
jgi:uncharacterized membrane protein